MELLSKELIEQLKNDIDSCVRDIDIPAKKSRLGELVTMSLVEDFWKDTNKAKLVTSEIEEINRIIASAEQLTSNANSLLDLFNTSTENEREQLYPEYTLLHLKFEEFENYQYLSGKYDKNGAIVSIHAGQGGTEADDWTQMLLRMYTRYCEKMSWTISITHLVPGNEVGYSTVTFTVDGINAFGLLKGEAGTHRLVRLSPFNSQNLRQTTFAGVEVVPIVNDDITIDIPESDIEFKAVRASGPGGQHVNKTSSAVQIKHIPTGIVVLSSEQRSQSQNRDTAMNILKSKLWQLEEEKKTSELARIKGEHKVAGWGNQIRNYVLHPYKLVKDLRTGVESNDPESVLNGELDSFISAEIRLNYDK